MNALSNSSLLVAPALSVSWQARALNMALRYSIKPVLELAPVSPTTMRLADRLYGVAGAFLRQLPHFVEARSEDFGHFRGSGCVQARGCGKTRPCSICMAAVTASVRPRHTGR